MNGLINWMRDSYLPTTPDIFTSISCLITTIHLLSAKIHPVLDEVFMGDMEKISIIKKSRATHSTKSMPTPCVFFLVGSGSNGKIGLHQHESPISSGMKTPQTSASTPCPTSITSWLFHKMLNIFSGENPDEKSKNRHIQGCHKEETGSLDEPSTNSQWSSGPLQSISWPWTSDPWSMTPLMECWGGSGS